MTMTGVNTFLESSTIHGLSYIAQTRKFAKLFWISVVLSGFIGAVYLINSSFEAWKESPVSTIMETWSIKKMQFPKVTVCPPQNTYTNLNYDILMANHTSTLDEHVISLLINTTVSKMHELETEVAVANFLEDNNRFRNWYFGYDKSFTKFPSSSFMQESYTYEVRLVKYLKSIMYMHPKFFVGQYSNSTLSRSIQSDKI